jgi:hypothetical protein
VTNGIQVLVLLTHKDRVLACSTFEEFKAQQIRLLDYMIEAFEAKDRAIAAADKFLSDETSEA